MTAPAGPEAPVAASAEIFNRLFTFGPDVMLVVDARGCIARANAKIELLLGYGAGELEGRPLEVLLPEHLRGAHERLRGGFMNAPRLRPMGRGLDLVARHKDGREVAVEISLAPLPLDAQTFVVVSLRDVSESRALRETGRKRARHAEQLARLSELALGARDLDQMLATIPALIAAGLGAEIAVACLRDEGSAIMRCKGVHGLTSIQAQAVKRYIESMPVELFTEQEVSTVGDLDDPAEPRPRFSPLMRELGIRSGVRAPLVLDGRILGSLNARHAVPHYFGEDEVKFMGAASNIVAVAVARLRAEEQLRHAQRIEAIGRLTGGIAHDFNNLLTVVSGNLELLQDAIGGAMPQARHAAAAMGAAARGAALTRNLLAFGRRQALRPRAVDLASRLAGVTQMLGGTLGAGIEIRRAVTPGLPPCLVDPAQLDNAIINLAINARDAMPQGGRLTVEAALAELKQAPEVAPGRYLAIGVIDTGCGMSPEVKARAFEPFFSTKKAGKGSGLGLSMVYGFAKQSGGHLTLYSEPGNGTAVRLYLPVAAGERVMEEVPVPAGPVGLSGGSECILVVEDDAEVLAVAVGFLAGLGYRVLAASDAQAALNVLARELEVSLLFTDIMLPGRMDGQQLVRAARAGRPGLRALLTTGHADRQAPLDPDLEVLRKPYRREELAVAVRAALDRA